MNITYETATAHLSNAVTAKLSSSSTLSKIGMDIVKEQFRTASEAAHRASRPLVKKKVITQ